METHMSKNNAPLKTGMLKSIIAYQFYDVFAEKKRGVRLKNTALINFRLLSQPKINYNSLSL
jgi:hypothetical protein